MVGAVTDVLIGVGVLAGMGLVVYAVIRTARRQSADTALVFEEAAASLGYAYRAVDDGRAQELAAGLGQFAVFRSSTRGETPPTHVIASGEPEAVTVAFLHATFSSETGRNWYVAIREDPGVPPCTDLIRIRSRHTARTHEILTGDDVIDFPDSPDFGRQFEVRAERSQTVHRHISSDVRQVVMLAQQQVGFPIDVSLLGHRTAVVIADRNRDLSSSDVMQLVVAARDVSAARS